MNPKYRALIPSTLIGLSLLSGCASTEPQTHLKPVPVENNLSVAQHDLSVLLENHIVAGDKEKAVGAYYWLEKSKDGKSIARSVTMYFSGEHSENVYDLCPIVKPLPTSVTTLIKEDGSRITTFDKAKPDCSAKLVVGGRSDVTTRYSSDFRIIQSLKQINVREGVNIYKFNTRKLGFTAYRIHNAFDEQAFMQDESQKQVDYIEWFDEK